MPTEAGRHRLYETIKQQWGQDNADELMSYLPPVGWADVATKQDLALLSAETRGELGNKIEELRAEMERGFARQTRWTVSTFVALTGVFALIVSWLG